MKRSAALALILAVELISSCGYAQVKYEPVILPVAFGIDTNGTISVSADEHWLTPIGEFSIEGGASKSLVTDKNQTLVVIRHVKGGAAKDDAYKLATNEQLAVEADGPVEIVVTDDRVFVDASGGGVGSVTLGKPSQIGPPPTVPQRIEAFERELYAADQRKDLAYLVDRLDPVAFQIFTRESCTNFMRPWLGQIIDPPSPVASYQGPGPTYYQYGDGGKRVIVENAFLVVWSRPRDPYNDKSIVGQQNGRLTYMVNCG